MKYDQIKEFSDEEFRSRRDSQFGVESMNFEKCNTKIQRYEDTKSEDDISHQTINFFVS